MHNPFFTPDPDLPAALTPPAEWYTDPALLEIERQKIFRSTWQYACSLDLLRLPSNYAAVEINGIPLVLVHGLDGRLRAFYNVCRHRAGLGRAPSLRSGVLREDPRRASVQILWRIRNAP